MRLSRLSDNVNTQVVEVETMQALAEIITLTAWAPGVFKNGYRNLANFESTDLIALDIDGGCSLEDARKLFNGYQHVIATTRNHQKEKNGVTCDRFRVILRLEYPITNPRVYTSTYLSLGVHFTFIDLACGDAARQFYKSLEVVSIQSYGKTIQPVERGAVAKSTIEFMATGAEKGKWNATLFKAAKDLQQQGYSHDETVELLKRPTGLLDTKDLKTIESAFNNEPRHPARIEETEVTGAVTVDQWVGDWIVKRKLDINYNEQIVIDGKPMNYGQVEDRLYIDTSKTGYKFPKELLFASLRIYYDDAVDNIVKETRKKLSFDDSIKHNSIGKFVRALEGQDNALTEAVLRHFIWSVKRKLNGLRVEHHLMPILVGKTNGGKTRAVGEFLKPLAALVTYKQLNIVNDERQLFNFAKYFVVFFDEMAHFAKADVECLKNIITSDVVAYRMMGKNKNSVSGNVSTFIGASNSDVKNIINDPTSARRYYQLDCQDVLDWATINSLDYLAMWRSVNECGPAPIKEHLATLAPKQEQSRQLSLIEEWLDMRCEVTTDQWTKSGDALRDFNDWVKANNLRASYRPMRFLSELSKLVGKKRVGNERMYSLLIKPSFIPQD